jgi:type VI protein secretion system component VasF
LLHAALRAALEGAAELLQRKPPVDNAQRLHRRIRSDLRFLETAAAAAGLSPENAVVLESQSKDIPPPHLASSTGAAAAGFNAAPGSGGGDVALLPPPPFKTRVLTAARLQGIANNLRGHTGELLAAQVHVACVAATAAAAAAATTVPLTAITHLALSACAADYVSNSVGSQLSWTKTYYRPICP